ncbi:Conserved hypothetical protein CHP02001 [Candidatus Methylopumilus universalis]|uniref:TorF family putative porin n=1 Tax=Candidatus Methylopumilus universalis TaxID=2588536 RepID=UPI003BEEDDF3
MHKSLITTAVLGALAAPSFVFAADAAPASDFTAAYNVGLFSQYIFRGLTQTNNKPALQGGFDVNHKSGLYIGGWASNVSWLRDNANEAVGPVYQSGGSLEIDLYGGFKTDVKGVGIDIGALQYYYPGALNKAVYDKANTTELYGALSYGWLQAKVSSVVSKDAWAFGKKYNAGTNGDDERGTYYAELNANIPLADTGITALIHVGRQEFNQAKSLPTNPEASYTDWKLGLTKGFDGGLNIGAFYTDTNISTANAAANWTYAGRNIGESTGTVFVQKTF